MAEIQTKKRGKAQAYNGSLDNKFSKCAHCGKRKKVKGNFGVRFMGPTRGWRPQSWCNKCRWADRGAVVYEFEVIEDAPVRSSPRWLHTCVELHELTPDEIKVSYKQAFPGDKQVRSTGTMRKRLLAKRGAK